MSARAWRMLKDAPKDEPQYVVIGDGIVVEWNDEEGGWIYWENECACEVYEDEWSLPIADTYELDRAVQSEIARAFGALIQGLKDGQWARGRYFNDYIAESECDRLRSIGLRAFAHILHTAMGGRIPDTKETDHVEEATQ